MDTKLGTAMVEMTSVQRVKALKKIRKTFRLAKERINPIAWRIYGPIVAVFMLWSLAAAKGLHYGTGEAVLVAVVALAAIYCLLRTVRYRDYWCMLFDLLAHYEPLASREYRQLQAVVQHKAWSEFESEFIQWYSAEMESVQPDAKRNRLDDAAAPFAYKRLRDAQPVAEDVHRSAWQDYAYPLQQITVLLQGTRHSEREHVIGQLQTVAARLEAGEMAGTEHDDDFGYSFKVVPASQGPSFFDGAAGRS